MRAVVVIASSTKGFSMLPVGAATVINACPDIQEQDEKPQLFLAR
jgi:hypothetical protein